MLQRLETTQRLVDDTVVDNTWFQPRQLTLRSIALERSTQCRVLMCEVKNVLRQARSLDGAADLDRAFFFDEFADGVQKVRREL